MLSHSEEIIFLEPIDQYFETNQKYEPKDSIKNESIDNDNDNDNLIKINFGICDLLNEENNSSKKELGNDIFNNSIISKKYLLLNNYVNINKKYIDKLKENKYKIYKSQIGNF